MFDVDICQITHLSSVLGRSHAARQNGHRLVRSASKAASMLPVTGQEIWSYQFKTALALNYILFYQDFLFSAAKARSEVSNS